GIDGAVFAAEPDSETNFKLFGPIPARSRGADAPRQAYALRLRPNQDLAGSLEGFCRDRGITAAKIRGGGGSPIGARLVGGGTIEPFATELAITSGSIVFGRSEALEATLDIALIDYTGGIGEGRLIRGDNPVLMTMELVLEVLE